MNPWPADNAPSEEYEQALRALLGDLRALPGCSAAGIWRWDPDQARLRLVAADAEAPLPAPARVSAGAGFIGQAAGTRGGCRGVGVERR